MARPLVYYPALLSHPPSSWWSSLRGRPDQSPSPEPFAPEQRAPLMAWRRKHTEIEERSRRCDRRAEPQSLQVGTSPREVNDFLDHRARQPQRSRLCPRTSRANHSRPRRRGRPSLRDPQAWLDRTRPHHHPCRHSYRPGACPFLLPCRDLQETQTTAAQQGTREKARQCPCPAAISR